MSYLRHAVTATMAAAMLLSVAACSKDAPPKEEQTFALQSSSQSASSSDFTSESEADSASESASKNGKKSKGREAEPTPIDEDEPRALSDGSFLLTEDPIGPGSNETIISDYKDLEEQGFSFLRVETSEAGRNGVMQFLAGKQMELAFWAAGLNGYGLSGEWGDAKVELLNESGRDVLNGGDAVKKSFLVHLDGKTPPVEGRYTNLDLDIKLDKPGKYTLKIEVRQPGYAPFKIRQPIVVVD
ncbi:hypothetical protein GC425_03980 [Corynebacterium sp. zg254]|uniref:Secreted protein n=1 Tax=Corynebacterium zhongnanshanii TaxID=2768834 RepID=A0ABQ6VF06_9CORY|nr:MULTISPECIES: hypothetical protein [Corynebacterium]KAB3522898.1 hypothetical protein F8377_01640 [Corynebacterium zhongnanshanii]MCR5914029.1 hypothetical protein [Corynebacterium sp. zg254]